jgi:hypothetical protein
MLNITNKVVIIVEDETEAVAVHDWDTVPGYPPGSADQLAPPPEIVYLHDWDGVMVAERGNCVYVWKSHHTELLARCTNNSQ